MTPAVAVTGLGIVSPLGVGSDAFWRALADGESGVAPVEGGAVASELSARVRGFDARAFVGPTHLRRMDELSRWIVAACRMALAEAGLGEGAVAPERIAIVVGSAIGNVAESAVYLERVFTRGPQAASPMIFPNLVLNASAGYAAMELGALGENFTIAEGEISGEHAIALGAELIRAGRADVVLAGGGDQVADILFAIHRAGGALAGRRGGRRWSSPYDVARSGVVLGEGAAMLALESVERARGRGARVAAEIESSEMVRVPSPAYDWPSASDLVELPDRLRRLTDGGAVDLVCGSANSSARLDACEAELVGRLLGKESTLTSIKGAVGDFGAAGALSTATACLALREQSVPPLCNLEEPIRPSVPVRFAPRRATAQRIERALVLGLARGGAGIGLLLRRPAA